MTAGAGLITCLVLQAAVRPVGIAVTSDRPGTAQFSPAIAQLVRTELQRAKVDDLLSDSEALQRFGAAGLKSARTCGSSRPCLAKLAAALGDPAVLVSVDVGKLGSKLVVHLLAIDGGGEALATNEFSAATASFQFDSSGPIAVFAESLATRLREPVPEPVAKQTPPLPPPNPVPAPPAAVTPPPEVVTPAPTHSYALPITLLSAGVVALAVGGGFGIDGLQAKSRYDDSFTTNGQPYLGPDGRPASHLTQAQLDSLRNHGNTSFTIALCTGALGIALAAISTWLFLSN